MPHKKRNGTICRGYPVDVGCRRTTASTKAPTAILRYLRCGVSHQRQRPQSSHGSIPLRTGTQSAGNSSGSIRSKPPLCFYIPAVRRLERRLTVVRLEGRRLLLGHGVRLPEGSLKCVGCITAQYLECAPVLQNARESPQQYR